MRSRIGVQLAADHVLALVGVHLDDPARLESHLEPLHDLSVERERAGRAHDSLGPAAVRGGEDLLGRHVRDVGDAGRRSRTRSPASATRASRPTVRSVPGPVKRSRSTLQLVERPRAGADPLHVRAPGGDGIVLVEPHAELDDLPQPVDVGLAEHLPGPALVGHADDRPVVQLLVDLAVALVGELAASAPCRPARPAGRPAAPARHLRSAPRSPRSRRRSRRRARGARAASTTGCRRPRTRSGRGGRADRGRRRRRSVRRPGRPRG